MRAIAFSKNRLVSKRTPALDLSVTQIDGLHLADDLMMIGAIGVNNSGENHPLGVDEDAIEYAAV